MSEVRFLRKRVEPVVGAGYRPHYFVDHVAAGTSAWPFADMKAVTVLRAIWKLDGWCQVQSIHPTICYLHYLQKFPDPPCFLQTGTGCNKASQLTFQT